MAPDEAGTEEHSVRQMLPSLFASGDGARAWKVARAAAYGAGLGAVAAIFSTLGPLHDAGSASERVLQIAGAAVAFALLGAGAAVLRNFTARRFIWPKLR
jgi:hypothetical protein